MNNRRSAKYPAPVQGCINHLKFWQVHGLHASKLTEEDRDLLHTAAMSSLIDLAIIVGVRSRLYLYWPLESTATLRLFGECASHSPYH